MCPRNFKVQTGSTFVRTKRDTGREETEKNVGTRFAVTTAASIFRKAAKFSRSMFRKISFLGLKYRFSILGLKSTLVLKIATTFRPEKI